MGFFAKLFQSLEQAPSLKYLKYLNRYNLVLSLDLPDFSRNLLFIEEKRHSKSGIC